MITSTNTRNNLLYVLMLITLILFTFNPILAHKSYGQDPTIILESDKKIYKKSEEIEIKSTISNTGEEITVDQIIVYLKENKIYFYPYWNLDFSSTRLTLPKDFFKEDIILKDYVQNHFQTGGEYSFAAAFTYPDSTEIIGEISIINIIVADTEGCPENMVKIGDKYCIDIYEASKEDATSTYAGDKNDGAAFSQAGVIPWNWATWFEAQQACIKSGKRLCTTEEWRDACDGTIGAGGNIYPYGNDYNEKICLIKKSYEKGEQSIPTGSRSECVSSFGVFDMNGNLNEWVNNFQNDTVKFKQLLGGGWEDSSISIKCGGRNLGNYPDDTLRTIGFRCCYPIKYEEDNNSIILEVLTQRNYLYTQNSSDAYLYMENRSQDTISAELIIVIVDSENQLIFYPDWQKIPFWENTILQPMQKMLLKFPIKNDLSSGNYQIAAGLFKLPELEKISEISIYDFMIFERQNGVCPEEMVPVGDLYCIDKYEESREDATSENPGENDEGLPLSRKGYIPWAVINHFQAGAACIRANKRLCTRGEWGDACDGIIGPGGWRYPYGDD
ncbi:SUMF1/EgtB/PvdO family nonheme iron enzyme, partial [bacterium]|nr:SUMF1/EgtB/PvdO family nonheme iron enzyme [bacterium]